MGVEELPQESVSCSSLEAYSFPLIFVFQNSMSGVKSSVDSVESTSRSVSAVPCCVRKVRKKERNKEREEVPGTALGSGLAIARLTAMSMRTKENCILMEV